MQYDHGVVGRRLVVAGGPTSIVSPVPSRRARQVRVLHDSLPIPPGCCDEVVEYIVHSPCPAGI